MGVANIDMDVTLLPATAYHGAMRIDVDIGYCGGGSADASQEADLKKAPGGRPHSGLGVVGLLQMKVLLLYRCRQLQSFPTTSLGFRES